MTAVSRSSLRHTGQIFHIRRHHDRSWPQTTDPESKKIKDFRGTGGVFNGKRVTIVRKI